MTIVNTYLYFNGNCEEAFNFYKSIFNSEFQYIGRYRDIPEVARQNFPHCKDEHIMHITLPISNETKYFSLYVKADSKNEADRLFSALSKEGEIKLPISDQFWGSYYGICLDKFGINWKISFNSDNGE